MSLWAPSQPSHQDRLASLDLAALWCKQDPLKCSRILRLTVAATFLWRCCLSECQVAEGVQVQVARGAGAGEHICEDVFKRLLKPEFSWSDWSRVACKITIRPAMGAIVYWLLQVLGELPCSPRVAGTGVHSLGSWHGSEKFIYWDYHLRKVPWDAVVVALSLLDPTLQLAVGEGVVFVKVQVV